MTVISTEHILFGRIPRRAAQLRPSAPMAFPMMNGQLLQITDLEGKQVATMVAFAAHDQSEYLSCTQTRAVNNTLMLEQGMVLVNNRRNPMFVVVEDTVGRHDILLPACDQRKYLEDYGLADHPNCHDNLLAALREHGLTVESLPDPVNWFMHVGFKARGRLEIREPLSEPNDYVLLRALMDVVVAITPCPQDQNASNAFNPTDILIRVYD